MHGSKTVWRARLVTLLAMAGRGSDNGVCECVCECVCGGDGGQDASSAGHATELFGCR